MPSKKDSRDHVASGIAERNALPEAFLTGLEAAAPLISALAASSNALGGPKQIKELLAKIDPITLVVKDSVQNGDFHQVTTTFRNRTPHGLYLESFEIVHPAGGRLVVEEIVGYVGINDAKMGAATLPYLLQPETAKLYTFKLPLLDEKAFLKAPYANVLLIYSKLDEKSTAKKEVIFRLRRKGAVT